MGGIVLTPQRGLFDGRLQKGWILRVQRIGFATARDVRGLMPSLTGPPLLARFVRAGRPCASERLSLAGFTPCLEAIARLGTPTKGTDLAFHRPWKLTMTTDLMTHTLNPDEGVFCSITGVPSNTRIPFRISGFDAFGMRSSIAFGSGPRPSFFVAGRTTRGSQRTAWAGGIKAEFVSTFLTDL